MIKSANLWFVNQKKYPEKLRRIKFYNCEQDKDLVFLTNKMDLKASEIAFCIKMMGGGTAFQMDKTAS